MEYMVLDCFALAVFPRVSAALWAIFRPHGKAEFLVCSRTWRTALPSGPMWCYISRLMRISLLEMRRGLDRADAHLDPGALGLPEDVYVSPVHVQAALSPVPGGWRVQFTASVDVLQVCDRCLAEVRGQGGATDACLVLERGDAPVADEEERLLLVDPEQEWVDLEQVVRDALRLALPDYFTCRVDCKGLCNQCGQDLNEGECGCAPPLPDSPFRDLARLRRDAN